jgi:L-asparaginase/Glu-tRNA(Gln) amidotransferase subunit D
LHTVNCPTCNKPITIVIVGAQRVLKAHDTDGRPLNRQKRASVCTGSGMVIPVDR